MEINKIIEKKISHAKSMKLNTLIEISRSICKIQRKDSNGTGFFVSFNLKDELFLVTAYHVIPLPMIESKKTIEIICETEDIKKEIVLDPVERVYYCFPEKDITIIEIINKDQLIGRIKPLEIDENCRPSTYEDYLNKDIFIMHHPKGDDLECNSGKIVMVQEPNNYEFQHTLDTEEGSSGSPILMFEDEIPKVIGMHTSACLENENNIGLFINVLTNIKRKREREITNIKESNPSLKNEIPKDLQENIEKLNI